MFSSTYAGPYQHSYDLYQIQKKYRYLNFQFHLRMQLLKVSHVFVMFNVYQRKANLKGYTIHYFYQNLVYS